MRHLTGYHTGLVGTAALVGIFVGGLGFGYLTDRVGRQIMYTINLLTLVGMSLLSALVTEPWQLIAARFLLDVAIGADYPIATSLLAEFLPVRRRGAMLGTLITSWSAGALVAALVGWALAGIEPSGWRWMLASPAVFGIAIVLARMLVEAGVTLVGLVVSVFLATETRGRTLDEVSTVAQPHRSGAALD